MVEQVTEDVTKQAKRASGVKGLREPPTNIVYSNLVRANVSCCS